VSTRSIVRFAWPFLLTLSVLTGCSQAPSAQAPSPSAPGVPTGEATTAPANGPVIAELDALLVRANKARPYSATLKTRTVLAGDVALTTTAQYNFNAPLIGYVRVRTHAATGNAKAVNVNEVVTDRFTYVREMKASGAPKGRWKRISRTDLDAATAPKLGDYARLLLLQGAVTIKGEQAQQGVPATRLSGDIAAEDVKALEPGLYSRLRSANVDKFGCNIWVDRSGRVIRLEQRIEMKDQAAVTVMTVSKFRRPLTVKAPTN
jgi:hypothetical protein